MWPEDNDTQQDLYQGALIGAAIRDKIAERDYDVGAQDALAFVNSYYKSPGFMKRLKLYIPKLIKENETIYGATPDINATYSVKVNPLRFKSIQKTDNWRWHNNAYYNNDDFTIHVGDLTKYTGPNTYDGTIAHELGHAVDNSIDILEQPEGTLEKYPLPFKYSNYISTLKKNYKYQNQLHFLEKNQPENVMMWKSAPQAWPYEIFHDYMPEEQYGDLMGFRYYLNKLGIFDSRKANSIFTKDMLNQIKTRRDLPFEVNRIINNFSDEDIIKIVNEVAYKNNTKINPIQKQV